MRTFLLCRKPLDRIFRADQILNVRVIVKDLLNKTPTLETIGKFADALEIDIRQLFDDIN